MYTPAKLSPFMSAVVIEMPLVNCGKKFLNLINNTLIFIPIFMKFIWALFPTNNTIGLSNR